MLPLQDIPQHWSTAQALAVYEWLDCLRERVWDCYGEQIQAHYRSEQQDHFQPDLFKVDDDMPF
ncbi:hypothetical protein CKO31_06390 [Thiohalocapsa halophila]|uniref:Uncharacterized protein n=1 Tax=Thiohalocapsa halophila TaxID=69359 RepID=A0ABS1CER4_9GAMM|nr:hypothetical protein [Thiohalocapsa halophila]MBK1630380.1 hypothetical protein [Thiohalocapsa halophila]